MTDASDAVRDQIRISLFDIIKIMCPAARDTQITWKKGDRTTVYTIAVIQPALGQVLGSSGKNVEALRVLVGAMGGANGFRAIIDNVGIIEEAS